MILEQRSRQRYNCASARYTSLTKVGFTTMLVAVVAICTMAPVSAVSASEVEVDAETESTPADELILSVDEDGEEKDEGSMESDIPDRHEYDPHGCIDILIALGLGTAYAVGLTFGFLSMRVWGAYTSGAIQGIGAIGVAGLAVKGLAHSESDGGILQRPGITLPFVLVMGGLSGYNMWFAQRHTRTAKFWVNFGTTALLANYFAIYTSGVIDRRIREAESERKADWGLSIGPQSVNFGFRF